MGRARTLMGSGGLACLTVIIVCAGLGDVPGVSAVAKPLRPVAAILGVEQSWSVFAPSPRRHALRLDAVVVWSDGRRTTWNVPAAGPALGAYRDYRWRKWAEHASLGHEAARLWRPAARYIVRMIPARPGAHPVELRFVRLLRPVSAPGEPVTTQWSRTEVYRARLGAAPP